MFLKGYRQSFKIHKLACIKSWGGIAHEFWAALANRPVVWEIMDNNKNAPTLYNKIGSIVPPLVTDSTNESQLKQSNLFPESLTNYTAVKMRMKWLQ